MRLFSALMASVSILGFFLMLGCGGSSSGGISSFSSLSELPDTSQMVATSSSTNSALYLPAFSGDVADVPLLTGLDSDPAQYFWNTSDLSSLACGDFWGGSSSSDDPGGFGACNMAQSIGYPFEILLQSGTSLCYMKNIPTSESGVAILSGEDKIDDLAAIFDQGTADRTVRVSVQDPDEGNQNVFIKVTGTDNAADDTYEVTLWFCDPDNESADPEGYQEITVNTATGVFNSTDVNSEVRGATTYGRTAVVTAFLQETNGEFTFDSTQDRTIDFEESAEGGEERRFKADVTISDGQVVSQTWHVDDPSGDNFSRRGYSVANFSGSGFTGDDGLKFLEGAFTDRNSSDDGYTGAFSWNTDHYKNDPEHELKAEVDAVDLTAGSFFTTAPTAITVDTSDYSCAESQADVAVSMDFTDSAVEAIGTVCESQRIDNMDFCWSGVVQTKEQACNAE